MNLLIQLLLSTHLIIGESPFFQSSDLSNQTLTLQTERYSIYDDQGQECGLLVYKDTSGLIYWYRRVQTPVCLTGECKLVDVGIYWDCTGDFFGIEIYGEHLTKTDHSVFTSEDYKRLVQILKNDWSLLREYELDGLVDNPQSDEIDGLSGATKTEIASETVENAVFSTYTIWHLVHLGEKEQLIDLTLRQLKNEKLAYETLIENENDKYRYFILSLLSQGKIAHTPQLDSLVLEGLRTKENTLVKKLSYQCLFKINLDRNAQLDLIPIYSNSSMVNKIKILSAFDSTIVVEPELQQVFLGDLNTNNEWLFNKLQHVLGK